MMACERTDVDLGKETPATDTTDTGVTDTGTPSINQDDSGVCEGHAPSITLATAAFAGPHVFDDIGEQPAMVVHVEASDEDGNLDAVAVLVVSPV